MQEQPTSLPSKAQNNFGSNFAKIIGVFILLLLAFKLVLALVFPQIPTQASDLTVDNILNGVNRERQLRNLLTLNANQMLAAAAQSKADDMSARHYFSHTDPEGNYIWPKIEAAGYTPYSQLGENLAIEFTNTESLISAWMNSPTHRANILNDGFKDQGMGLTFGNASQGQYSSVVVNTFGTLITSAKQPVLAANTGSTPAPAPSTQPAVPKTTATQPKTPTPIPTPKPAAAAPATTTPSPAPVQLTTVPSQANQPLAIRTGEEQPSFATPQHMTSSTPAAAASTSAVRPVSRSTMDDLTQELQSAQTGRYVTLGIGFLLLLLLLSDLKVTLQKNLKQLDKKANNLVLLVLAIIVVALMYWL